MRLENINFQSSMVDGPEPVRRTAALDGVLVLAAQGNFEEDRWVFGWPTQVGTLSWKLVEISLKTQNLLLGPAERRSVYALIDNEFELVHGAAGGSPTPLDIDSFLQNKCERQEPPPTLMVVSNNNFQIEVIFNPDSYESAALTVLTNSQNASKFGKFMCETHALRELREDPAESAKLLDLICSRNVKELSYGIKSQGSRR